MAGKKKSESGKTDSKGGRWKAAAKLLEERVAKLEKKLRKAVKGATKAKAVSPLAPAAFPDLPVIAGVEFASAEAGVRYKGREDVMLIRLAPGSRVAGVFTQSATRAAPVLDCQAKLAKPGAADAGAAIIVNAGNANAFSGAAGVASVAAVTGAVGETLGIPAARVFSASTGVIGEPLPHERITAVLETLKSRLATDGIAAAARAFMTTDTFPKGAGATVQTSGGPVQIAGIAKGSGMIAPDMATMLVYIFTDAAIPQAGLQKMLSRLTDRTFNAITVDGDTSTSDTLMLAATGQGPALTDMRGKDARAFERALEGVMRDLAHQVVRDGEGATKFVEIAVTGAASALDARRVAMSIANSPLVKTAIAGEDANWGRIVMAVGKSGAEADRDRLSIRFGDITVARDGQRAADYSEEATSAYMKGQALQIGVDLGLGRGAYTAWTCDLTHRYIDINADYRS
jgi:glutamate N-acetyltransferase/amino-acid N-acetyltransferase